MHGPARSKHPPRGVTLPVALLMLGVIAGLIALSVDVGRITLARTQLQTAADAAALAAAARLGGPEDALLREAAQAASRHSVGGAEAAVGPDDVEPGAWDPARRVFVPAAPGSAVRVTARTGQDGGLPLLFGAVLNRLSFTAQASAVAAAAPRDIAFVVDLSGPADEGEEAVRQIYEDFGFGPYPGESERIGAPWGVADDADPLAEMARTGGPLAAPSVPSRYRIGADDAEAARKQKACSAVIDLQIARLMPNVRPRPSSATHYAYWEKYLEYLVRGAGGRAPGRSPIGYRSYVEFMLDHGRDVQPAPGTYVPLSRYSPECPWRSEETAGGTLRFPPREQPLHSVRRALIAALEAVRQRSRNTADSAQRDWVAIVGFDGLSGGGPAVEQDLTDDYGAAMRACARLQGSGGGGAARATEAGLVRARALLRPRAQGGQGRPGADKVIVLVTSGPPTLYVSPDHEIDRLAAGDPGGGYYPEGKRAYNAPLVQTSQMQLEKWQVFPIGAGPGADYGFLDRMARLSGTAGADGGCPRPGADPAGLEQGLTRALGQIIASPQVRLVQ